MKKRLSRCFFPALLSLLALPSFSASGPIEIVRVKNEEYLPLDEILSQTELDHSFDMISGKGRLYRKGHYAVYGIGLSIILVDGGLYKSPVPVRRKAGRVLIPFDAAEKIVQSLRPGVRVDRDRSAAYVRFPDNEDESPERKEDTPVTPVKDRIRFIVIDPGHGGKDPGALGKGGIMEKDITLAVSKRLEKELKNAFPDLRVFLTRSNDRFIELSGRTAIANKLLKKSENGIFLSVHVNSALSSRISGYETYFLSQNPTNEDARNTAALENNVIVLEEKHDGGGTHDDVDYIEAMMITTQIQKESAALAACIQKGLSKKNRAFASRGVKKADFFVLRGVLMPAVLVEIGYISNIKEARQLKKEDHQRAVAAGIAEGVELFIKKYNSLIKIN
ncbi:MAG: N-acetylmuramoyl-L-alanine amidase [Spirochaetes bacterium]|nr:N-acetylmuramoyl-L-alanine amidase [Spirochaetota bacterium]